MKDYFAENSDVFTGLNIALSRTKNSTQNTYKKVLEAQKQYFINNTAFFSLETKEKTTRLLEEALHKFLIGSFVLEQIWAVQHYLENADKSITQSLHEDITTEHNSIVFLLAALLDESLYGWRSFLDFYLKYLLYFSTGKLIPKISVKKFQSNIDIYIKTNNDDKKALNIRNYINENVISGSNEKDSQYWGDILRSLRDKTTHQELIRPLIKTNINHKGLSITWPTVMGQNYSELVQLNFENKAFEMFADLNIILYNFEWRPGPFKTRMFE